MSIGIVAASKLGVLQGYRWSKHRYLPIYGDVGSVTCPRPARGTTNESGLAASRRMRTLCSSVNRFFMSSTRFKVTRELTKGA
jgi:hypothetical protein